MTDQQVDTLVDRILARRTGASGVAVFVDRVVLERIVRDVLEGR